MRNIKVHNLGCVQFPCRPVGVAFDNDNDMIYIVDDELRLHCRQNTADAMITMKVLEHRFRKNDYEGFGISQVKLVEFLVEMGCILLVLEDGQMLLFDLRESSLDIILVHPKKISSIKLSPGQDLVSLLDSSNDLFMLNSNFEIKHKTNIILNNSSLNKPVGVGWGSKETQFF